MREGMETDTAGITMLTTQVKSLAGSRGRWRLWMGTKDGVTVPQMH